MTHTKEIEIERTREQGQERDGPKMVEQEDLRRRDKRRFKRFHVCVSFMPTHAEIQLGWLVLLLSAPIASFK